MSELEILDERRAGDRCERTVRIAPTLRAAEGHFPGFPIVPGFVQVGWAIEAARPFLGDAVPRRIEALKFKEILRPGDTVVVITEQAAGYVRFSLERGGAIVSSGRFVS